MSAASATALAARRFVVVTHGANPIEETAFLLSLAVRCDVPVVLVGAMRPANAVGSDGTLNLLQAATLGF